MNDLNTIIRLNAEAQAAEIPKAHAAGKFVVARYAGLSYVGHSDFDTAAQAQAEVDRLALENIPGHRTRVLEPTESASYTPTGDTSPSLADLEQASANKRADNEKAFAARSAHHIPATPGSPAKQAATDSIAA